MSKKKLLLLSGVALIVLLASLIGVSAVFAQESTPTPPTPGDSAPSTLRGLGRGGGRGRGGFGGGLFGGMHGNDWTMFDTAAEALGLTPVELFTELHAGKTLDEIAEAQGVEMDVVQDALNTARSNAMRQAIEQAVEDGRMSQEQADWLLEGLEKGFAPMGRGFGRGGRWGGCPPRAVPETESE